jgi:N-acetylneuraminate synthase/N,N'-diacetyllegionaminate synthase
MKTLAAAFGIPVGFSDHTRGLSVAFAAIGCGATVLEKHFTLDRTLPGPDHAASLEPNELSALVEGARQIEIALGDGLKRPAPGEHEMARIARRSLVITRDSVAGTVLSPELLDSRRPGTGISPDQEALVVGRALRRDMRAGSVIQWDDL